MLGANDAPRHAHCLCLATSASCLLCARIPSAPTSTPAYQQSAHHRRLHTQVCLPACPLSPRLCFPACPETCALALRPAILQVTHLARILPKWTLRGCLKLRSPSACASLRGWPLSALCRTKDQCSGLSSTAFLRAAQSGRGAWLARAGCGTTRRLPRTTPARRAPGPSLHTLQSSPAQPSLTCQRACRSLNIIRSCHDRLLRHLPAFLAVVPS